MFARDNKGVTKQVSVPKKLVNKTKLTDDQITELARLSVALEKHYFFPQDSEFAVNGESIYIVQTRPITTTESNNNSAVEASARKKETTLELDRRANSVI